MHRKSSFTWSDGTPAPPPTLGQRIVGPVVFFGLMLFFIVSDTIADALDRLRHRIRRA